MKIQQIVAQMTENENVFVVEGGTIYPYFKITPEQYAVSNTQYAVLNRAEFMNRRGIQNATLSSLADYLPDGAVIAGGFLISVFNPKHTASDIDIFFTSGEDFLATYDMLCSPPLSLPVEAWAWRGYKPDVSRAALLTHSNEFRTVTFTNEDPTKLPIQLIKIVWFGEASDVIDSFDFTVCQFAVTRECLIFNPMSWVDLQNQEIIIHKYHAPVDVLYRIIKYVKKGYKTSHLTLVETCESIRSAKEIQSAIPNIAKYT